MNLRAIRTLRGFKRVMPVHYAHEHTMNTMDIVLRRRRCASPSLRLAPICPWCASVFRPHPKVDWNILHPFSLGSGCQERPRGIMTMFPSCMCDGWFRSPSGEVHRGPHGGWHLQDQRHQDLYLLRRSHSAVALSVHSFHEWTSLCP